MGNSDEIESLFQVRRATAEDAYSILSITKEAFLKYEEMAGITGIDALNETYEDVIRDIREKIVLIAIQDGAPVGSVRVAVNSDNAAYLSRFAVKVTSQNNGIGKSIMNLVDRIMIKEGVSSISLHTGSKITSLIRFYYGRGFYIDSTDKSRGYVRALLKKDYKT